jgi:hypothetical protein
MSDIEEIIFTIQTAEGDNLDECIDYLRSLKAENDRLNANKLIDITLIVMQKDEIEKLQQVKRRQACIFKQAAYQLDQGLGASIEATSVLHHFFAEEAEASNE